MSQIKTSYAKLSEDYKSLQNILTGTKDELQMKGKQFLEMKQQCAQKYIEVNSINHLI